MTPGPIWFEKCFGLERDLVGTRYAIRPAATAGGVEGRTLRDRLAAGGHMGDAGAEAEIARADLGENARAKRYRVFVNIRPSANAAVPSQIDGTGQLFIEDVCDACLNGPAVLPVVNVLSRSESWSVNSIVQRVENAPISPLNRAIDEPARRDPRLNRGGAGF